MWRRSCIHRFLLVQYQDPAKKSTNYDKDTRFLEIETVFIRFSDSLNILKMYICESDKHSILQLGTLLPFAFFKHVFAEQPQFTLPAVPTSVCNGAAGSGVATFSSQWPAASVVEILDGGYTHQSGGQWKICNFPRVLLYYTTYTL